MTGNKNKIEFGNIWEELIEICSRKTTIFSILQGKPYEILEYNEQGIRVGTEKSTFLIAKEKIEQVWSFLTQDGELRVYDHEKSTYRSSFIFALFLQLDMVELKSRSPLIIKLKQEDYKIRNEERIHQEIRILLNSENLDFDMDRKLPEMSTRVDFFIFSKIPTVIEIIRLSRNHFTRKSVLISKLLTLKLINDGHIRVISIFFVSSLQNENLLKKLKGDLILEKIADEIIILDKIITDYDEFKILEDESIKIKNAIKKEIKIEKIIHDIVKLKEIEVSFSRVNFVLDNLYSFPSKDSFILSFYFNLFKDETKDQLKLVLIENHNKWFENQYRQDHKRYFGNFYINSNPEVIFNDYFKVKSWNFNDTELQAIIYEFSQTVERKLERKKKLVYPFMYEPFYSLFMRDFNTVNETFKRRRSGFKHFLESNGYYNFRRNFFDYLLYYCLRNSKFKDFTPIKSLKIENEDFRNYQKFEMSQKLVIIKTLDLDYRYESFLSLLYFGNYIRGFFFDEVILIVFLVSRKKGDYIGIKNEKKKLILLEENGWKTYPLGSYNDILLKLNELYEELI